MSLSDSDWLAWLESEDKTPVVLVELGYYDIASSSNKTFRCSQGGYCDPFDVDAPNYLDLIRGSVTIDDQGDGVTVGSLAVLQEDDTFEGYQFKGQTARIYFGDQSWPRADFRQAVFSKIESFLRRVDHYVFTFEDVGRAYFDQLIKGNGRGAEVGLPFVFGRVFNLRPTRESAQAYVYFTPSIVNINVGTTGTYIPSGYGTAVSFSHTPHAGDPLSDVRDNGVSIADGAHFLNVPDGAGDGLKIAVALDVEPAGDLTCDNVPMPGSLSEPHNWPIFSNLHSILTQINSYAEITIDIADSIHDFDDIEFGYVFYSYTTARQMLTEMFASIGGNPRVNVDGELELFQVAAPATSSRTVYAHNIKGDMVMEAREAPYVGLDLGYRKNWAVQDATRLAGSVSAEDQALYGIEYSYVRASRSLPAYPWLKTVKAETMLVTEADAQNELDRRFDLRSVERQRWSFRGDLTFLADAIGDTLTISDAKHGGPSFFPGGADFVLIGRRIDLTNQTIDVTVWK